MNVSKLRELQFAARIHTLPITQKRSLLTWLRSLHRRRCNGHPHRHFYIINPTGGLDPL